MSALLKKLIVTADDFGLCREVNEAVAAAHTRGVLTAASLMVRGDAVEDAVAVAKANPRLGVGLHLVLVQGRSVLPKSRIPDIVDEEGNFADAVAASGVRYFFSPAARRQVAEECEAQVRRFLDLGLKIDHIDGHTHLHIHPTILEIVIGLARKYRIPAVRLPRQPIRSLSARQAPMAMVMAPWVARTRARLRAAGLFHNDAVFGLFETGRLDREAWRKILAELEPGVNEVYGHPATHTRGVLLEQMPGYHHAEELAALQDPELRRRIADSGIVLGSFSAFSSA